MKKNIGLLLVLLFFSTFNLHAQNRGLTVEQAVGSNAGVGKQWAVFIAIDRYQEWGPLSNPVRDAKEIRDILLAEYYIDEVRELYDREATARGIRQLLVDLNSQVGRDDSVFVFYAGHGHTDRHTKTGSWIPADGARDEMAQTNWLPNVQVRNMLDHLKAKHVFLIADSCFSGDILDIRRGAAPQIDSEYYRKAYSRVSRQVMTSGASEEVPDASEFAQRLKSALRRADGVCIDPEYLFTVGRVREVRSTQPMLGAIRGGEHQEGGSFLFFRKEAPPANAQPPATAVIPVPQPAPNPAAPAPVPLPEKTVPEKPKREPNPAARLWSVGVSAGSAFSAPLVIGTVRGTIAPLEYSFLEIGLDVGAGSGYENDGYYSLYPYARYCLFAPFSKKGGWYIGAGAGYMISRYTFQEGQDEYRYLSGEDASFNIFAGEIATGFNILNMIDISYSLRTDFKSVSNKASVGYTFRFK